VCCNAIATYPTSMRSSFFLALRSAIVELSISRTPLIVFCSKSCLTWYSMRSASSVPLLAPTEVDSRRGVTEPAEALSDARGEASAPPTTRGEEEVRVARGDESFAW